MITITDLVPHTKTYIINEPCNIEVPENLISMLTVDGPEKTEFIGRDLHFKGIGIYTLWYYSEEDICSFT
jgi:hypothetical protein